MYKIYINCAGSIFLMFNSRLYCQERILGFTLLYLFLMPFEKEKEKNMNSSLKKNLFRNLTFKFISLAIYYQIMQRR